MFHADLKRARSRSARRGGALLPLLILALLASVSCQHERHGGAANAGDIPRFNGLGSVHHAIGTRSAEAQRLFDQGLRLCYAFNHEEAIRSFREAARLDSSCAMCWWGVALAYGPNINLPMSAEAEEHALDALARARSLASNAPPSDRAYIDALSKRYAAPAGADRATRDSAYADAMRSLRRRFPNDPDAATLSAEALMDLRPWDLYTTDGTPQPGTAEIIATLEEVLRAAPSHTGALHLYLHALEASSTPERAEGAADRLATLTPEAGHLIHMPSHIYLRVGRYADAEKVNARAIQVDRAYIDRYDIQTVYRMMYYPHNIHMRWSALCSAGRRAAAAEAARDLAKAVPWEMIRQMPPMEFFRAADYFTPARFGAWDEILRAEAPPAELLVTSAIWRYTRGLALAATGRRAEAQVERDSVSAIAARVPDDVFFGLNPGRPLLEFASVLLAGEIAARGGKTDEAIGLFTRAVSMQDSLRYDEPPPWYGTARQALGALLLRAGRAGEAAEVYRADLKRFPENGWSLYGLARAEAKGAGRAAQRTAEARFKKAWADADVELTSSWF